MLPASSAVNGTLMHSMTASAETVPETLWKMIAYTIVTKRVLITVMGVTLPDISSLGSGA